VELSYAVFDDETLQYLGWDAQFAVLPLPGRLRGTQVNDAGDSAEPANRRVPADFQDFGDLPSRIERELRHRTRYSLLVGKYRFVSLDLEFAERKSYPLADRVGQDQRLQLFEKVLSFSDKKRAT